MNRHVYTLNPCCLGKPVLSPQFTHDMILHNDESEEEVMFTETALVWPNATAPVPNEKCENKNPGCDLGLL